MSTPEETALPAVVDIHAGNGSLQVYDRISDPLMAIKVLGNSIFKSGIFGITKPSPEPTPTATVKAQYAPAVD